MGQRRGLHLGSDPETRVLSGAELGLRLAGSSMNLGNELCHTPGYTPPTSSVLFLRDQEFG